ncbi:MAG: hypothetical protein WBP46_20695 [Thiolinea sp.]
MSEQPTGTATSSSLPLTAKEQKRVQFLKRIKIDSIIFLVLVIAALIGVAMTNSTKAQAYLYWWILIGVEAVIVTAWAVWLSRQQLLKKPSNLVLYEQLVLWGAALGAVFIVYRIMILGQIDFNAAGLLMLLVLALVTFIDGALVSWKLFVVSLIFIITLLFASYVEKFLWTIIILALLIAGATIGVSYWRSRKDDSET